MIGRSVELDSEARGRSLGLDALRVLGALLVFWVHVVPFAFRSPLGWPASNGRLGVYVFFALSAYLLTRQLLPGADLTRYFVARAVRILPAYWAAVVGITLVTGTPFALQQPIRYLTMTQAWFPATGGPLNPTWTLSVEALFYMLLPLLVVLLRRRWGIAALVATSLVSLNLIGDPTRVDAAPLMLWAFLPGMLVAWAEPKIALPRWLAMPGLALIVTGVATGSAPLMAVAAAVAVAGVRGVQGRWLRLPADLSYAFYLWQYAVIIALAPIVAVGQWFVLTAFLVAVGVAAVSWLGIERPVLRRAAFLRTSSVSARRGVASAPVRPPYEAG